MAKRNHAVDTSVL